MVIEEKSGCCVETCGCLAKMLHEWGMELHVHCHGTNISEELETSFCQ